MGLRVCEGVKTLFRILGEKYKFPGGLAVHMLMTPVVEVSQDHETARGMGTRLDVIRFKLRAD